MRISLCLLVFNERQGCEIDVPNLPLDQFEEVYAVDPGSTDGTIEYLESRGITVHLQTKPGLNAAYVDAARLSTCDAVVVFFPKGTLPVEDVLKFRPLLEQDYDLVVASRNIKGGKNEEDGNALKPRKWSVLMLARLAALVWRREGHLIHDVLHGVKGFSVSGFRRIDPLDTGLSIDLEMVIRSYKLRLPRMEFPTTEHPRSWGTTHFKFLPTGMALLKYLWHEVRRRD